MKNTAQSYIVLLAATAVVASLFSTTAYSQVVRDGNVDLIESDLSRIINLSGTWRSTDEPVLADVAQFDYNDESWQVVEIPALFSDQGYATEGQVWYRAKLQMPRGVKLKGYIESAGHSHIVYAATPDAEPVIIASSGSPHLNPDRIHRSREPVIFDIPESREVVLTWRIANVGYVLGGPYYPIQIAEASVLASKTANADKIEFAFFWVYLLFGAYFVMLWNWNRIDYQSLSVGLLSWCMALRTAALSGQLEQLIPGFTFRQRIVLEGLSFTLLLGVFPLTIFSFFPKEFTPIRIGKINFQAPSSSFLLQGIEKPVRKGRLYSNLLKLNSTGILAGIVFSAITSIIVVFSQPVIISQVMVVSRIFGLAVIPVGLLICTLAYERGRSMSTGIMIGVIVMLLGVLHEILASMGYLTSIPNIVGFTFICFLMILGFVIARRNQNHAGQLKRAMADAQKANVAKSQFLTSISHEIRTPLTAIMGYSQLVESELRSNGNDQSDVVEFVNVIRSSGDRLLLLVNDLLDMAKAETGKLDLQLTEQSAASCITDVVEQVFPLASSKGLNIRFDVGEDDLIVFADGLRLRQVVLNIISNAIKFTDVGSVTISISEKNYSNTQWCVIDVEDTGPGISKKFIPKVFERFTQEERTYESAQRGTGLGMAISKELIERMGGSVQVTSVVGTGSTFTIELPLYRRSTPKSDESGLTIGSSAA